MNASIVISGTFIFIFILGVTCILVSLITEKDTIPTAQHSIVYLNKTNKNNTNTFEDNKFFESFLSTDQEEESGFIPNEDSPT